MSYQLAKRTYSELKEISSKLYARATDDLGLNISQALMYVEEETNLLRDEESVGNNVPLYVVIFKVGLDLGLVVDKTDPDFEFLLNEFQVAVRKFNIGSYSDSRKDCFVEDYLIVKEKLGI